MLEESLLIITLTRPRKVPAAPRGLRALNGSLMVSEWSLDSNLSSGPNEIYPKLIIVLQVLQSSLNFSSVKS